MSKPIGEATMKDQRLTMPPQYRHMYNANGTMKKSTEYEWLWVYFDEYDDIIDRWHVDAGEPHPDFADAVRWQLCLTRRTWMADGDLIEDGEAWVTDGAFEDDEFDCGHDIPQKYIKQLDAWK